MEMIGVTPLPPAKRSRSWLRSAGVKIPLGGRTRMVSPGLRMSQIQLDAYPSTVRLTVTVNGPSSTGELLNE